MEVRTAGALLAEGQVLGRRRRSQPAPVPQRARRRPSHSSSVQPRVSFRQRRGELPGGLVQHQRLDAGDPVVDQQGDVAVATELTQQGLGVPQGLERRVRPGEVGVPAEEGASLGALAGPERRPVGPVRRRSGTSSESAAGPSIRRRAAPATSVRASSTADGVVRSHTPSIDSCTRDGLKLKKVATTVPALTGAHRRRAGGEVPGPAPDAQPGVGGSASGAKYTMPCNGSRVRHVLRAVTALTGEGRSGMAHGNRRTGPDGPV